MYSTLGRGDQGLLDVTGRTDTNPRQRVFFGAVFTRGAVILGTAPYTNFSELSTMAFRKRSRMSRSRSRRSFRSGTRVKSRNSRRPMRGGYRV